MAKKDKKKDKDPNEEGLGGKILSGIFVVLIIIVWVVILGVLIKLDIGGFGSGVLRPVLKDVPLINKILPEPSEEELLEEAEDSEEYQIATLSQAKDLITKLQEENEKLTSNNKKLKEEKKDLEKEVERLKTFETAQADFQKQKEEFYNQIVYGEDAPDADTYKEWYESIDAENAERIYRQVLANESSDAVIKKIGKTYANMKPKEAATVLEKMGDWDVVASIMSAMKPEERAKIMDEMDPDFAAWITRKLMP